MWDSTGFLGIAKCHGSSAIHWQTWHIHQKWCFGVEDLFVFALIGVDRGRSAVELRGVRLLRRRLA